VPCDNCGSFTKYPTPWDAIVGYESSPDEELWRCGFFLCSESCAQGLCDRIKKLGDPRNPTLKVEYANIIKSLNEQ
jgi:hypothetical protein